MNVATAFQAETIDAALLYTAEFQLDGPSLFADASRTRRADITVPGASQTQFAIEPEQFAGMLEGWYPPLSQTSNIRSHASLDYRVNYRLGAGQAHQGLSARLLNRAMASTGVPWELGAGAGGGATYTFDLASPTTYSLNVSSQLLTVGMSQVAPILPDLAVPGGPSSFTNAPTGRWFDPPATDGFKFEMTGTQKFSDILSLPVDIDTDGQFTVVVDSQSLGSFAAGTSVNFVELIGHAVSSFTVLDIDPVVNATSPTAFPIQLAFNAATADFTMTPSTLFTEGDSNLDGSVNFDDLLTLAQNYGAFEGELWNDGDFTFDGAVNFDDLLALAQNYGTGSLIDVPDGSASFAADWALARSLVPEPTMVLASMMLLPMSRRWR